MKKILYIATVDMFSKTGGGMAVRAYYNALVKSYSSNVDLMHAYEFYKDDALVYDKILLKRKPRFNLFLNFIQGHVHRFYPDIINYLKANSNKYSICIINGGVPAGDSIIRLKKMGLKVIVIHHNFEPQYHKDNKTLVSYGGLCTYWISKYEKISYKNADLNLFLTTSDIALFKENYGHTEARCSLLGCFDYKNINLYPVNKMLYNKTFVITGSLDFYQTEYGIIDFCNNYFHELSKTYNNLTLIVAGRNPRKKIKSLKKQVGSQFILIPNPDNIYDCLKMGSIFVCPISTGGGLKLRIMDGLRYGMPIITHLNSARGYEHFIGKPYFQTYHDYNSFFKAFTTIEKLYNDGVINAKKIQKDYLSYFGFYSGCERIKFLVDELIQK